MQPVAPKLTARLVANRLNATKSTGPKSAVGKATSRMNSLRHGLTRAVPEREITSEAQRLSAELALGTSSTDPSILAAAETIVHLRRVRAAKSREMDTLLELESECVAANVANGMERQVSKLLVLDGYERKALSRMLRAINAIR